MPDRTSNIHGDPDGDGDMSPGVPAIDSKRIESLIVEAGGLMNAGAFDRAIPVWQDLLELGPEGVPAGAYARLVSAHRKLGQLDDVLRVAERARRDGKMSDLVYVEIAMALSENGRHNDAVEFLVEAARKTDSLQTAQMLLQQATDIEARHGNVEVALRNLRVLLRSYPNPLAEEELRDVAAFATQRADRERVRDSWELYWQSRKDFVYLHVVRRMIEVIAQSARAVIDVGSNRTPILDYFGTRQSKYSIDIEQPYRAPDVTSIDADFLGWTPPEPIQVGTCLQVLEEVDDPRAFLRHMLAICEVSIVSCTHLLPIQRSAPQGQNGSDLFEIEDWAGRKPNFHYIAKELSGEERLICVFDTATRSLYPDLHPEGKTGQSFTYRWSLGDFVAASPRTS